MVLRRTRRTVKRHLAILLVGLLVSAMLPACGQDETVEESAERERAELLAYTKQIEAAFTWLQPKTETTSREKKDNVVWGREIYAQIHYWKRLEKVYRQFARDLRFIQAPQGIRHAQLVRWAKEMEEACWLFYSHEEEWLSELGICMEPGEEFSADRLGHHASTQMLLVSRGVVYE